MVGVVRGGIGSGCPPVPTRLPHVESGRLDGPGTGMRWSALLARASRDRHLASAARTTRARGSAGVRDLSGKAPGWPVPAAAGSGGHDDAVDAGSRRGPSDTGLLS